MVPAAFFVSRKSLGFIQTRLAFRKVLRRRFLHTRVSRYRYTEFDRALQLAGGEADLHIVWDYDESGGK